MKPSRLSAALGPAALLFVSACGAMSHARVHQNALKPRHSHGHTHAVRSAGYAIQAGKRTCKFPTDDPDLVAVTPESLNAGWAMSPDRECLAGQYCPYACKTGMLMAQWEPDSSYTYPSSMNGGLHCGDDGVARKPFPDRPYCDEGTGAVKIVNQCRKPLSWCQTVLPGSELMAIPTLAEVKVETTISVPGSDYWCATSAHYYVNPPGTGAESCVWGTESEAIGNWSPFVAGFNTVSDGRTFVKIGWNPKFLELDMGAPDYSLKVECPDGGCHGLPCEIRSSSGKGNVQSNSAATGAGDAKFCVVTVAKDKTAVVVSDQDSGRNSSSSVSPGYGEKTEDETEALRPNMMAEKAKVVPESTQKPASEPATTSETSTAKPLTTVQTAPPPPPPVTTSSPAPAPSPVSSTPAHLPSPLVAASNSSTATTSRNATTSKPSVSTMSRYTRPTKLPGAVFHENATAPQGTVSSFWSPPQSTPASVPAIPAAAPPRAAEAGRQQGSGAVAGLVVALVAAACFF